MCNQQTDKNLVEKTEPALGIDNADQYHTIAETIGI